MVFDFIFGTIAHMVGLLTGIMNNQGRKIQNP